ncbi:hypothetical protein PACTADRAFT_31596 [Pachysolen tannophilus NRRL Y-2460]|uniref:Phosphoglycerate mutase n=1 Tax=Pachysolen tannophilus NRRL Y-2460 TaxID=669874 RepID=A0A1E4U2G8_PACTA|nr:hypothetical protein PACTADRAFT_31596 [Pachysolen tannophilus NRRL Y-2460]
MSDNEKRYKIIILRHGESEWNKSNLFCGWVDVPLSDKGKDQAVSTANLILQSKENFNPTLVFTSKLTRSCQTANIILEKLNKQYLDIYRSWRLNERHYGKLQGETKSVILAKFGKEKYMYWRRAYEGCPPPSTLDDKFCGTNDERYKNIDLEPGEPLPVAESLKMVVHRLMPYFNNFIKPKLIDNNTILIVTHGSVVRALIKEVYQISDEDIININIPNGIPMVITLDENFEAVGDYFYLDPEIAKIEAEKVARQGFENHHK